MGLTVPLLDRATGPARTTRPAGTAGRPAGSTRPHLLELLLLLGRENLVQLRIDFLLQTVELLSLFGRQVQLLLQEAGQNLSGLRGRTESAGTTRPAWAAWTG